MNIQEYIDSITGRTFRWTPDWVVTYRFKEAMDGACEEEAKKLNIKIKDLEDEKNI